MIIVVLLASLGLGISWYGYTVELKTTRDVTYKPSCDISDRISCTKAFTSPYGKLFGVSNTLVGMVFYVLVLVLAILGYTSLVRVLTVAGMMATGMFAYLLFVKVKSYCLVCAATYVVNILLLLASF
jgi:Predicted membrane protein